jgi:hypothetical protein
MASGWVWMYSARLRKALSARSSSMRVSVASTRASSAPRSVASRISKVSSVRSNRLRSSARVALTSSPRPSVSFPRFSIVSRADFSVFRASARVGSISAAPLFAPSKKPLRSSDSRISRAARIAICTFSTTLSSGTSASLFMRSSKRSPSFSMAVGLVGISG